MSETLPPACEVADVDRDISAWIERLTAKEPTDRPASAAVAWEQLEEILLGLLGPRWRRTARLLDPPHEPFEAPASQYDSFAWDSPRPPAPAESLVTSHPVDVDGIGPDTPALPRPPAGSIHATTPPSPSLGAPVVETSPPPAAVAGTTDESTVPPGTRRLARGGAVGLLAALLIPLITSGDDRWNVFAVLSPFEAVGITAGVWVAVRARTPVSTAAGALLGFGVLATAASLALLRFALHRLDAASGLLAIVVVCAAAVIVAAGVALARRAPARATVPTPVDTGVLLLGLIGAALACAALFVKYDGYSSLWSEVGEGESAEFFVEPMVAVVLMLAALGSLGTRPRLASALLFAVGSATALHFVGALVAAWRAIGEVGELGAAGFIGVLGGLLAAAAAIRSERTHA